RGARISMQKCVRTLFASRTRTPTPRRPRSRTAPPVDADRFSYTSVSFVAHQYVAHAAHGLDVARLFRVRLELGAQLGDVDVDRSIEGLELFALERVHQVLARQHSSGGARQAGEQLELEVGEHLPLRADGDLACVVVD